jgi:hypothetical protein
VIPGKESGYAMTEQEWIDCQDIRKLLEYLVGRTSNRKFRLFGCACCRRIWHLLVDERSRRAVCVAERYADGLSTEEEMDAARREMAACRTETALRPGSPAVDSWALGAAEAVLFDTPVWNPGAGSRGAFTAAWTAAEAAWRANAEAGPEPEGHRQLPLLRDIFENPYRPGWADAAWLTPQAIALAETIYAGRRFSDLPILADALEEGGCDNAELLAHCRQPGPHVRGCWAADLLLSRE